MLRNDENSNNYGDLVNLIVGGVGVIGILIGIVLNEQGAWNTIFLSVGTSMLATAIVTKINASYLMKSQRIEKLVSTWQLYNIYKTKADMNTIDANKALEQCRESIDIIGEGLSSYIAAQGNVLQDKILKENIKIRIISCDSAEMLELREKDESRGWNGTNGAVGKVLALKEWVEELRKKLGDKKESIQIRYHSTYPGLSYLRIDSMLFISANLWRRPSQQSFAISFSGEGEGGKYFKDYFDDIWENFSRENCGL